MSLNDNLISSLTEVSSKNRFISEYVKAYNKNCTPHNQDMFHPIVRNCCSLNKTCTADLRVSKVCFVGESGVGKTSIINRFCHNSYNRNYKATIGVDFEVERFTVLNIPYKLQIWDTAGQERFRSVSTAYYRGSHVIVSVFDLSDLSSLDKANQWMEEAGKLCERPLKFFVGNKTDLIHKDDLSVIEESLEKFCHNAGAELWCVSAKIGHNITDFFCRLTTVAFEETILKYLSRNSNQFTLNQSIELSQTDPSNISKKDPPNIDEKKSCVYCIN